MCHDFLMSGEQEGQSGKPIEGSLTESPQVPLNTDASGEREIVPEYPVFVRDVASISPESATALKREFGISDNDLIVGMPAHYALMLGGLEHGQRVQLSLDGQTLFLGDREIRFATGTRKGPLTKFMFSRGIRQRSGLQDHRETGTEKADLVPVTAVKIGGQTVLWIKAGDKNTLPRTE